MAKHVVQVYTLLPFNFKAVDEMIVQNPNVVHKNYFKLTFGKNEYVLQFRQVKVKDLLNLTKEQILEGVVVGPGDKLSLNKYFNRCRLGVSVFYPNRNADFTSSLWQPSGKRHFNEDCLFELVCELMIRLWGDTDENLENYINRLYSETFGNGKEIIKEPRKQLEGKSAFERFQKHEVKILEDVTGMKVCLTRTF